jgi:hypothetical protein
MFFDLLPEVVQALDYAVRSGMGVSPYTVLGFMVFFSLSTFSVR